MKTKGRVLLFIAVFCLFLSACGDNESKRPIDYPDAKWICESAEMEFSVSDNEIGQATIKDKNGTSIDVTVSFSDASEKRITVADAQTEKKLFAGDCSFGKNEFTVRITDYYGTEFDHLQKNLTFKRT